MATPKSDVINAPPKPEVVAPPSATPLRWIILESNKRIPAGGQFFGANGDKTWLLKAGVPAAVPETIINILNDAVMSEPVMDDRGETVIDYADRLRFPYRFVDAPK